MKLRIIFCIFFTIPTLLFSQNQKKLIITSILKTDFTFTRNEELLLDFRAEKNQIIYSFDSATQNFKSYYYLSERYHRISGDKIKKERIKRKNRKWKNTLSLNKFRTLCQELETNNDSIKTGENIHTSHYNFSIYINIIDGFDTIKCSKTQPFEYNTIWLVNEQTEICNPNIDKLLADLLPKKFLGNMALIKGSEPKK